jgi:hypothetical protein
MYKSPRLRHNKAMQTKVRGGEVIPQPSSLFRRPGNTLLRQAVNR